MSELTARFEGVTSAEGHELVIDVWAWVQWLTQRGALEPFHREQPQLLAELVDLARASLLVLLPLRKELVERLPDAEDRESTDELRSLRRFDQLAAQIERGELALPPHWERDTTLVPQLGETLAQRFNDAIQLELSADGETSQRADLEREVLKQGHLDFERSLISAMSDHRARFRQFTLRLAASGFTTLGRINALLLEDAPASAMLRACANRLQRLLVTSGADLQTVADHYRTRCEKFDRAELRKSAKTPQLLATHAAKYFFDQGLGLISFETKVVSASQPLGEISGSLVAFVLDGAMPALTPRADGFAIAVDLRVASAPRRKKASTDSEA